MRNDDDDSSFRVNRRLFGSGLMPGTYAAVYNGTKVFNDSFADALPHEVTDEGIGATVLMSGLTDRQFVETVDLLDTEVGAAEKDDPAIVAKVGDEAMSRSAGHEVPGFTNKMQAMMANFIGDDQLAKMHEGMAKPRHRPSPA